MADKIDIEVSKNEDQGKTQVTRHKGKGIKLAFHCALRAAA